MSILKFRVMYEEDDTVFRDIDIKPAHSLMDLEAVIHSSYNLPSNGSGIFFMSNDNWQKGRTIHPLQVKEEKKSKARLQNMPTIVSFLDDPHQHFIYEYQGTQEFAFLIELISVGGKEDFKTNYPVCVRTQGASPFKKEDVAVHFTKHVVPVPQDDEAEEEVEEEEEETPFVEAEDESDSEDLEVVGEEEKHDLMDGDAIEESSDEEGVDEDFAGGDDFNPEDFNEGGDEFDDEELR